MTRGRRRRCEAVHGHGIVITGIALLVAALVFGVLALLEKRDLLTAVISWP